VNAFERWVYLHSVTAAVLFFFGAVVAVLVAAIGESSTFRAVVATVLVGAVWFAYRLLDKA